METLVKHLIDLLTDYQRSGPVVQWSIAISVIVASAAWLRRVWRSGQRRRALSKRNEQLASALQKQTSVSNGLEKAMEGLSGVTPSGFSQIIKREVSDHNYEKSAAIAEAYCGPASSALTLAADTLLRDALAYTYIDRQQALTRAQAFAVLCKALDPENRGYQRLGDSISAALNEEHRKLKPEAERQILNWALRTPPSGDVLFEAAQGETLSGHDRLARELLSRAVPLIEATHGKRSEHAINAQSWYGTAMAMAGDTQASHTYLSRVADEAEHHLGMANAATLNVKGELAESLRRLGKHQEARALHEQILFHETLILGPEDRQALITKAQIAGCLSDEGNDAEAERRLRHLVPIKERVLGPENPETLYARRDLSTAIWRQGRADEAEPLLRDLIRLEERVMGPDHPETLNSRYFLACVLLDQGHCTKAEGMLTDVLLIEERVRGPEHQTTFSTRRALAQAALEQGEVERAHGALDKIHETPDHPHPVARASTAMLRGWLADLDGDASRAAELLDAAERGLGHLIPEHYTRRQLARYRETRVPGGAGGTMIAARLGLPEQSQPPSD